MLQDPSLSYPASASAKQIRRKVSVPYHFLNELVKLAKDGRSFPSAETDAEGRRYIPVEQKVYRVID